MGYFGWAGVGGALVWVGCCSGCVGLGGKYFGVGGVSEGGHLYHQRCRENRLFVLMGLSVNSFFKQSSYYAKI